MSEMRSGTTTTADTAAVHPQGTPNWVDLQVPDVAAALDFYCGLFGWEPGPEGPPETGGYRMPRLGGATVCGVMARMQESTPTAWTVYFAADDCDAVASRVDAHGGRALAAPMDVMDQVRMGIFADPAGAVFGISQERRHHGFEVAHVPGSFGWAELATSDLAGARSFYPAILPGVTEKRWQGEAEYHLLVSAGEEVAGMFSLGASDMPPSWTVSFQTSDLDRTLAGATVAGATVLMGPTTTPGVGSWAVLHDPQGAVFGLLQS